MSKVKKTVTFGIIAYNEHRYLPEVLDDLLRQTYPHELVEVILVDGESTDDTWTIMQNFHDKYKSQFLNIKLIRNRKRIQPAGWNLVIKNSTADVLLRIDAHARLSYDFIENNIKCINTGEYVCGGPRENIIDEDTPWKRMLLEAEQSMFGAGIAAYRQETKEKKYVKSLFHGCYRKEVLDKVGLFNEDLIRTEDNEYHYRIRESGYNICYDPNIKSLYQTRNSLEGMIKQKFLNGLWIGRTLSKCPRCLSLFHLVPFVFVCIVIVTTILLMVGVYWPAIAIWSAYGAVNVLMTLTAFLQSKNKSRSCIVLPVVFLLLHLSYGLGTLFGIVKKVNN